MIGRLSDSKVSLLAWLPLPPHGPPPPEAPQLLLFSDGVQYCAGWYCQHYIQVAALGQNGPRVDLTTARRMTLRWAKLNNLLELFDGTLEARMAASRTPRLLSGPRDGPLPGARS